MPSMDLFPEPAGSTIATDQDRPKSLGQKEREAVIRRLVPCLRRFPEVAFAFLYGSFLEDRPFRDLDIGLYLNDEGSRAVNPLLFAAEVALHLEEECHLPMDVRVINDAPLPFLFGVVRGRLLFEAEPGAGTDFMEDVARRYLDMEPLRRRAFKEVFGG